MKPGRPPLRIEVANRQRRVPISRSALQAFGEAAVAEIWQLRSSRTEIHKLYAISIVIVSDRRMAELHNRFTGIHGTTDVLTFRHGEIVISADAARRQARTLGATTTDELCLYTLHGLLHLAGFDDRTADASRKMNRVQETLFQQCRRRAVGGD